MKTEHTIKVACTVDDAFKVGLEVEHWAEIFPPCLVGKVLNETENEQKFTIAAWANDEVFCWESLRGIDRENRRISFSQTKPSPLVRFMKGSWRFEPDPKGCLITLSHDYEIADEVSGFVKGVETQNEAENFMLDAVEMNSNRELKAISDHFEREHWRFDFQETLMIQENPDLIISLLSDAGNWPKLLPHCKDVQMIYDDGVYQEFIMIVQVGDKEEHIRSVRILGSDCIDYFQPSPPPALREHRGKWKVINKPDGVEVISWHDVVLNPDFWVEQGREAAQKQVVNAINNNSLGTMKAIMEKFGGKMHD